MRQLATFFSLLQPLYFWRGGHLLLHGDPVEDQEGQAEVRNIIFTIIPDSVTNVTFFFYFDGLFVICYFTLCVTYGTIKLIFTLQSTQHIQGNGNLIIITVEYIVILCILQEYLIFYFKEALAPLQCIQIQLLARYQDEVYFMIKRVVSFVLTV